MTLLTIANNVAENVGLDKFDTVASNTSTTAQEMLTFINDTAEELVRRVDWGGLTSEQVLSGTGASVKYTLDASFSHLTEGICVTSQGSNARPLERAEWSNIAQTEGIPRYFLLEGSGISLFPYLANGQTATVFYQNINHVGGSKPAFDNDSDASLIPEDLIEKGAIYRWRRQKGLHYSNYFDEYQDAINDYAQFDDRVDRS
ncbi:MAG: hypothetical protein AAFW66_00115 [Pseudomonadota bacterium]